MKMELKGWFKRLINRGEEQHVLEDFSDQPKIMELRDQIDRYIASKVRDEKYFSLNNTKVENEKILAWEKKMIEGCFRVYFSVDLKECTKEQRNAIFHHQNKIAELMDELRTEGPRFSPDKMVELAELMRNSIASNGIIELGRINAEYGIIKQGAEVIFPEYDQLCKELGQDPLAARQKVGEEKEIAQDNQSREHEVKNGMFSPNHGEYVIVNGPLNLPFAISPERLREILENPINLSPVEEVIAQKNGKVINAAKQKHNLAEITAQAKAERNAPEGKNSTVVDRDKVI